MPPIVEKASITKDTKCRVWDRNAKQAARVHEPVPGITYKLRHDGDGTEMPYEHAIKFLRDPSFRVHDPAGNELKIAGPTSSGSHIELPPHQVVAGLDELTVEALINRAKVLRGGHAINKNWGKERIVDFIIAGGLPEGTEIVERELAEGEAAGDVLEGGEDDGDVGYADTLLGGSSAPKPAGAPAAA
jgi:hypothetical protein